MVLHDVVSQPARIHCREIDTADIDGIVNLLTSGFRKRSRGHWVSALKRLSEHPTPPGFPKYGYLLDCKGSLVGVHILIFSSILVNGETRIRCNTSSLYVEPAFRGYAAMLVSHALKYKQVAYFNITPAPQTLPILEAQGYTRYCNGWFVVIPAICGRSDGGHVKAVPPDIYPDENLRASEVELLLAHASYGCISLICDSANRRCPFVFVPRRKFGLVPYAYLAYCRDMEDFVRFAGPLGRFLAWHGFPLIILDSNGPIRGVTGMYFDTRPKYFKGPHQPRLGDLAYSELAMFLAGSS
jgi:hypothetical protein